MSLMRKLTAGIIAFLTIVLLCPFEMMVVTSQRVLVATKDMHPINKAVVQQIWARLFA
jgi:hypothetical protein